MTKRNTNSHSYKLKKNTNHGLQARNQFTARPGIFQNFFSYTYTWKKQILPTSHKQIPTTPTLHHTSTHLNPTLTLSSFKFFSTLPRDHQILLPSPHSNTPTQAPYTTTTSSTYHIFHLPKNTCSQSECKCLSPSFRYLLQSRPRFNNTLPNLHRSMTQFTCHTPIGPQTRHSIAKVSMQSLYLPGLVPEEQDAP